MKNTIKKITAILIKASFLACVVWSLWGCREIQPLLEVASALGNAITEPGRERAAGIAKAKEFGKGGDI
ncbi:hypothetical protein, partial [Treponema sp. R6D11]